MSNFLTAVHDDGSHTAPGETNHLVKLPRITELKVRVANCLGVKYGEAYVILVAAKATWQAMPVAQAADDEGEEGQNEFDAENEDMEEDEDGDDNE